jgi:hypothetical protein
MFEELGLLRLLGQRYDSKRENNSPNFFELGLLGLVLNRS